MSDKELFIAHIEKRLHEEKDAIRRQWLTPEGTNTRHFFIDDLLPPEQCQRIYEAFPKDGHGFFTRDSFREKKRTSANLSAYDPILSEITYAFQYPKIVDTITESVGFTNIEPDPELYAGGLSMMFCGDYLNPHIDNSHDAKRKRYRRLNLLYHVSPDWGFDSGGNFELWDESRMSPKTIVSRRNRLVVMETNKTSWHSVSPVNVDGPRCCVSNYYFSEVSPDETDYFHVTSFSGRPDEKLKRLIGSFDNALRNFVSTILGTGRGKNLVNKSKN